MADALRLGESPRPLDLDVIENGVEREAPMAPGVTFRILPWAVHNPRYKRALQEHARRDASEGKVPKGETLEEAGRDYMAARQEDPVFIVDAVLADIEGLLNEKGNPIQYTRERGIQILSDPEWAHLRDWLVGESWRIAATYKREVDASGNGSRPASSGKRGGAARSAKTRSS
jgi:hypothetical protein